MSVDKTGLNLKRPGAKFRTLKKKKKEGKILSVVRLCGFGFRHVHAIHFSKILHAPANLYSLARHVGPYYRTGKPGTCQGLQIQHLQYVTCGRKWDPEVFHPLLRFPGCEVFMIGARLYAITFTSETV